MLINDRIDEGVQVVQQIDYLKENRLDNAAFCLANLLRYIAKQTSDF